MAVAVTAATLESIAVTPANPTLVAGDNLQLTATGTYSNGSTQNLSGSVTWTSSSNATATVSTTGLVAAVAAGSANITATNAATGKTNFTTVTVTSATLTSIAVTPSPASVAAGITQQFSAVGTYSDASTANITALVTWVSANPGVATINSAGLGRGVAAGTTQITAMRGAVTSPAVTLTVTAPLLSSIAVTPVNPSVPAGRTQQFAATGTYTDGSTATLTTSVNWTSSNGAAATIALNTGLATSVAVGTTNITATDNATLVSGFTTLTVTARVLDSIAVTPSTPSMAAGRSQQLTATGTYSAAPTANITAQVTWTSSNTIVASVSASGIVTALNTGSATITATDAVSGKTGTATVTVYCRRNRYHHCRPGNPDHRPGHDATVHRAGYLF